MARTKQFEVENVLDAAVGLFWKKGYHATSANDLVEHLGVSRSSLYDTFGDKRNLYLKSLHQYRKRVIGRQLYLIETATDIKETLEAIFSLIIEQDIDDFHPRGCMLVNAATEMAAVDEDVAAIVRGNQWDLQKSWEMAIKKAQYQNELRADLNPKATAAAIYNALIGMRVALKTEQEQETLDAIVRQTLRLLD